MDLSNSKIEKITFFCHIVTKVYNIHALRRKKVLENSVSRQFFLYEALNISCLHPP